MIYKQKREREKVRRHAASWQTFEIILSPESFLRGGERRGYDTRLQSFDASHNSGSIWVYSRILSRKTQQPDICVSSGVFEQRDATVGHTVSWWIFEQRDDCLLKAEKSKHAWSKSSIWKYRNVVNGVEEKRQGTGGLYTPPTPQSIACSATSQTSSIQTQSGDFDKAVCSLPSKKPTLSQPPFSSPLPPSQSHAARPKLGTQWPRTLPRNAK